MPYLLVLILLTIIGGPWLVGAALALTGIWFSFVWIITGICLAALLILALVFALASLGTIWGSKKPKRAFGAGLDPQFKDEHEFEPGIYEEDKLYIVEINGRPNYFWNLDEARYARDNRIGSAVEVSAVPEDHPSRRPYSQR